MILLTLASLGACAPTTGRNGDGGGAVHGEVTVPLGTVVFSGHRYVADADLGWGKPVPIMVHGNARMFLMVTHETGEQLTGGPVTKVEEYGYSAKGKGRIHVPLLRFGTWRIADLRDVPVFDFLPEGGGPVRGMVGVPFLTTQRAAIDFSRDVMILGVEASAAPNRRLLDRGYRQVPMTVDANDRVIVQAFFPALGRTIPITPSTVSSALTLHRPPFAGKLPMTRDTTGTDASPSGTRPEVYNSDGVAFEIAGAKFNSPASLEDFAEYAKVAETDLSSLGLLGYDWMKEHEAIIDYGNRFFYFRP